MQMQQLFYSRCFQLFVRGRWIPVEFWMLSEMKGLAGVMNFMPEIWKLGRNDALFGARVTC
jgi:hypothetical protein